MRRVISRRVLFRLGHFKGRVARLSLHFRDMSKAKDIIKKALSDLRRDGYSQVSASELCHKTGLSHRVIIASLKRSRLPNFRRGDETYFRLNTQQEYFSDFVLESAVYSEVN